MGSNVHRWTWTPVSKESPRCPGMPSLPWGTVAPCLLGAAWMPSRLWNHDVNPTLGRSSFFFFLKRRRAACYFIKKYLYKLDMNCCNIVSYSVFLLISTFLMFNDPLKCWQMIYFTVWILRNMMSENWRFLLLADCLKRILHMYCLPFVAILYSCSHILTRGLNHTCLMFLIINVVSKVTSCCSSILLMKVCHLQYG